MCVCVCVFCTNCGILISQPIGCLDGNNSSGMFCLLQIAMQCLINQFSRVLLSKCVSFSNYRDWQTDREFKLFSAAAQVLTIKYAGVWIYVMTPFQLKLLQSAEWEMNCDIWSFHSGISEDCSRLGCDVLLLGSSSEVWKARGFANLDRNSLLHSVTSHKTETVYCTLSHPIRLESSIKIWDL